VTKSLRLGLVGLGKIARDQHLPAIAATPGLELVAVASRAAQAEGVANYPSLEAMLAAEPQLDAVILCQPPQVRYGAARMALAAGRHVFLEKPPGVTVTEVEALAALAQAQGVTLFASWHARFAAAVGQARSWLAERTLRRAEITWKEDVRHWHPGQSWIFEPGGFGVFDPGVNALSILTEVVREPIRVVAAELDTPANRQAPIAARLALETSAGARVDAVFDFRQTGPQTWDIVLETGEGRLVLSEGGAKVAIDAEPQCAPQEGEYGAMYRHFTDLVRSGISDVDVGPLKLVADAFLCARRGQTEAFEDE
jgi:D-galactose 1-dehydrogenase